MLKVGATFDYGSRPLLQIALHAFEEWSPDLHPHALFQRDFVDNITKLRMLHQNLIDFTPEVGVLVSHLIVRQ